MERKRLPSDTTLDELFEAAISGSEAVIAETEPHGSDVISFLSHYNIKQGTVAVKPQLLYKIYKIWSKIPIKQIQFILELSLYFVKKNNYYLINKSPFQLAADLSSVIKKKTPPATRKRVNWEHFKLFLKAYDVSSGTDWVESYVVHHFYDKWVYNNKKKKVLAEKNVELFLKMLFETRQTKNGLMVKINHNFEKASIQNLREAWKRKQKGPK